MPFVRVLLKPGVTPELLEHCGFDQVLRASVANATDCADEGGRVTPSDVDVQYVTRLAADQPLCDITVMVQARRLPTRTAEQDERSARLRDGLVAAVPRRYVAATCITLSHDAWAVGQGAYGA